MKRLTQLSQGLLALFLYTCGALCSLAGPPAYAGLNNYTPAYTFLGTNDMPLSVAIGNLTNAYPGNEVVVTNNRPVIAGGTPSQFDPTGYIEVFTWIGSALHRIVHYETKTHPTGVAVGDVNSDGTAEIVATYVNGDPSPQPELWEITVFQVSGSTLTALQTLPAGRYPSSVAIGDVNGDGKNDVVTADREPHTVTVLLQSGGVLQPGTAYPTGGNEPIGVVIGKVTSDSGNQVVVTNSMANNITVFYWSGGGLVSKGTWATQSRPFGVALGDLNNDGKQDVVTANLSPGAQSSTSVFLQAGGTLAPAVNYNTGLIAYTVDVAVGDFTGDGLEDVAVTNGHHDTVGLFAQNGGGTLDAMTSYVVGDSPGGVAGGDITGDGFPDVVLANSGLEDSVATPGLSVLTGTNPDCTLVDWNGDNEVNLVDLDLLAGAWGANNIDEAAVWAAQYQQFDVDNSGTVDRGDFWLWTECRTDYHFDNHYGTRWTHGDYNRFTVGVRPVDGLNCPDDDVNLFDFLALLNRWNTQVGDPNWLPFIDTSQWISPTALTRLFYTPTDGRVHLPDFLLFQTNWSRGNRSRARDIPTKAADPEGPRMRLRMVPGGSERIVGAEVWIDSKAPWKVMETRLRYDPNQLQVMQVQPGELVATPEGFPLLLTDRSMGELRLAAARDSRGVSQTQPGSGMLLRVLFRGRGHGRTDVQTEEGTLIGPGGNEIRIRGAAGELVSDAQWLAEVLVQSSEEATRLMLGQADQGPVQMNTPWESEGLAAGWGEHPEGTTRTQTDLRETSPGGITWPFWVRAEEARQEVQVSLPQLRELPSEYDLRLVDRDNGATRSLRTTSGYRFRSGRAGEVRHLEFQLAPKSELPLAIIQFQVRPSRAGVLAFDYSVTQACQVRMTVSGLSGKTIQELPGQEVGPGVHVVTWDGKDAQGRPVPWGRYLVQLEAEQEDGNRISLVRDGTLIR